MKFKYLLLSSSILLLGFSPFVPGRQRGDIQVRLDQFDLITADSGWVLLGQQLFWTLDEGETWGEIGPSVPSTATMQDVEFVDANTGWILWSTVNAYGGMDFTLASTENRGKSWSVHDLSLFDSGEVSAYAEVAGMGWLDAQSGWISVKQASSSNFSLGTLFTTSDGGKSWVRSSLPIAGHVVFISPDNGWVVGGATGDQVFKTQDNGITWERVDLGEYAGSSVTAYEPSIDNIQGLLVTTSVGLENSIQIYGFEPLSDKWEIASYVDLDVESGAIGLSILDPNNFVATIPGTNMIIKMDNGALNSYEGADGLSASIVELSMASLDVGWAKSVEANCATDSFPTDKPASVSCESINRLLMTKNGGLTWQNIQLPSIQLNTSQTPSLKTEKSIPVTMLSNPGNTNVLIGQGFDKCEIPTISQLQTWADHSPYQAVNLYIGGSSRACSNTALTASYLYQLHQQGWQFIPTWVGPQAPCTGYLSRMSSDPTTAFSQGVAEADLAVDRLAELGLTYPDETGSVVYYDVEYYGTNTACRDAVNAFMNGWVSQIHARGNLAGVYGSTLCDTGLSDFLNITNVPDVIWPARWYHNAGEGYYDPSASVWNLGSCIPNTVWADHQRIRQYEGDHDETWGDLTLGIDSNVIDGVVAVPYFDVQVSSISRAGLDPTNAASVDFTVIFSGPVTGVDIGDFALTTTGVTGASLSSVSDIGDQSSYTVTVNSGSGDGTIRLDLIDNDSIEGLSNNPLGGVGAGNGDFSLGEIYTIQNTSSFGDVAVNHPYWPYIEILYANGYTGGCSVTPLLFCPNQIMDRAQSSVFMLRGNFGSGYTPVVPTHFFEDNWADAVWAEGWAESMYIEGLTAGCKTSPLKFCPYDHLTNVQAAVFGLRLKFGMAYLPPAGTGTVFADMTDTSFWGLGWAEQVYAEGIIPSCGTDAGTGKPRFCPNALVDRGFGAYVIVAARNLSMP